MGTIENNMVVSAELKILANKFENHLPEAVEKIITLWNKFKSDNSSIDILKTTYDNLHKLTGSAGTFGYPHISRASRKAEIYIQTLIEHNQDNLPDDNKTEGNKYFLTLRNELDRIRKPKYIDCKVPNIINICAANKKRDVIVIIEANNLSSQELSTQLTYFGYKVSILKDIQLLTFDCLKLSPTCIILNAGSETINYLKHVKKLRNDMPYKVAIFVIGENDNIDDQLLCLRSGASLFLSQPVDAAILVDRIDSIVEHTTFSPPKIMIIEDSKHVAEFYSLLLKNSGMEVHVVVNPMDALLTLDEFCPELILMDLNMPECNGIELASIIRYKENYISIPIVYLSSEENYNKRIEALFSGADEFLTKPINEEYLIASVFNRVERYRKLKKYMVRDSLTNIYNHSTINDILTREISRASREKNNVAFVMIDIDHFKKVNDLYGHPTGDKVIKSLARLISQRIRAVDSAGRYGGEEFAVVLTNITRQQASKIINDLRRKFEAMTFKYKNIDVLVTFSAGIAMYNNGDSVSKIKESADKALYISKSRGRNKVTVN